MTAALQTRVTFAKAAKMMNVPERAVYLALELQRSGRADLVSAVERGEIKLHAALKIAKPEKYGKRRDRLRELVNVWSLATDAERAAFLASIGEVRQ
jgi:hypothetical protein